MMFEQWCVFLGLVTLVAGGVVKMPEELPADIAADNAYLDDFAANALLSVEERKIVAPLERIESKFGTLQENEKDEVRCSISSLCLIEIFSLSRRSPTTRTGSPQPLPRWRPSLGCMG